MKNNKVTLLATVALATLTIGINGVKADEEISRAENTELTSGSPEAGSTMGETTQTGTEAKPEETKATESTVANNEQSGGGEINAPVIEKNGSEIVVSNLMVGSWLKKED